jgi:hypothetical protein
MRRARRVGAWLIAGSLLAASAGCGDGKPAVDTSTTEAKVTGKVTVKGKAATRGKVTLDPSNSSRKDVAARSSPIGKDGTYEVTTLVGANAVSVDGTGDPAAGTYNTTTFDVQSGTNTLNLELPLNK